MFFSKFGIFLRTFKCIVKFRHRFFYSMKYSFLQMCDGKKSVSGRGWWEGRWEWGEGEKGERRKEKGRRVLKKIPAGVAGNYWFTIILLVGVRLGCTPYKANCGQKGQLIRGVGVCRPWRCGQRRKSRTSTHLFLRMWRFWFWWHPAIRLFRGGRLREWLPFR